MSNHEEKPSISPDEMKKVFEELGFDLQSQEGKEKAAQFLKETKEMLESISGENLSKISQYIAETKNLER